LLSPRKANVSDYPELISFLNGIFGIRMDLEYSHIYRPTAKDMANNIIAVDDGRIVSCVGIFPMTFACGGVRLRVGGIGGVSTNPEYRSRGLMTKLMNEAMEIMRRRQDDISILWGDRLRYARFGYENAGRHYTFNIDRRHVLPGILAGREIRPLSFTGGDLSRIARLYRQWELRVERSPAKLKSVFGRDTYETWVWLKGQAFAYMTIKGVGADRDLIEFGGETEGLENLLGFLFDKYELENLTGTIPYCPSLYVPFIIARSSGWGIGFSRRARCEMVKILDLASLLSKFAAKIGQSARGLGLKGSLTLEMTDSHQVATLHFGRGVSVSERKAKPALHLSDTEMVRLIFGTIPPSHSLNLSKPLQYLDEVFPLDFYVSRLDWV
jgi:predicted N-acetyltransferase YhbS